MSALYQRARPVRFDEVVGQDHVIEVLGSAVRRGRIGHAYLFSGPRGVGKTTTARLLAMAANCENEDASLRPCGTCESCRLVQAGAHPDVTELDAASNNSVDDVRELRERVGLAGLRGGTRVWILDEAHMLSRAAANALLKTLEEPPPGLLFILATTEPEKLPPTVLSRCQHFRFRRLAEDEIVGKLTGLCTSAQVDAEPDALRLVARVADGGMRDAESMLERLLLIEGGITAAAAEEALGLPPHERLETMAQALAAADLATLLTEADGLYRAGFSPRTLAEQLGRTLRDALVGSVRGDGFRLDLPDDALMRSLHLLDDDMERFVRHNDLYALEVALIKALNAARDDLPVVVTADAPQPSAAGTTRGAAVGTAGATPEPQPPADPRAEAPAAGATHVPPEAERKAPPRAGSAPATGTAKQDRRRDAREEAPAPFDPHGRPRPERESTRRQPDAEAPAAEEVAAAGAPAAQEATQKADPKAAQEQPGAAEEPAAERPISWRAVKAAAGAQLKAFLMPAQESVEGSVVRLRYDAVHRFHHGQLLQRSDELAALVTKVAGPGTTVLIEGPEGGTPKKIA